MSQEPLVIIGNGEIAAMAFEYFTHDSEFEVVGFSIDESYMDGDFFCDRPLTPLSQLGVAHPPDRVKAFVAIGDARLNRVRRRHFDDIKGRGYQLASYVSSKAFVWHNVVIGENCFVLEHNILQPFVVLGDNVTLWSGNHIGHRSVIEDNVFIASHVVISGFCRVGMNSFIGVNAALAHQVNVAEDNFIAMGASVTASTQPDSIYQGSPAAPRKMSARRFCKAELAE